MNIGDKFWHLKDMLHDLNVTATLVKDVDAVERTLLAGTRVRIVMMSRFGDVGITDQLDQTSYCARVGGEGIGDMQPRNPGDVDDIFTDIDGMTGSILVDEYFKGNLIDTHGPFEATEGAKAFIDIRFDCDPGVDYKTNFRMRMSQ